MKLAHPLVALLPSAVLAACGGGTPTTGTLAAGDVARYCELVQELDEQGEAAFGELEKDPDAREKDYEQVGAEFLKRHEAEIDEVEQVAPEEIRADVGQLTAGVRERAGEGAQAGAPSDKELDAAEQRVNDWERENCPAG